MQIVNQATVQSIRNEFTGSCNRVADQASAKFASVELQVGELHATAKAIVDRAGQEFHTIKSTISVTASEAHANKAATKDDVTFQTHNSRRSNRGSAHWRRAVWEAAARRHRVER